MTIALVAKTMTVANTVITVLTVPTTGIDFATLNLGFVNEGTTDAILRIALSSQGSTPNSEDYIEYGAVVPANGGIFDRTCVLATPGEKVMVFCDKATVAARVVGLAQETI